MVREAYIRRAIQEAQVGGDHISGYGLAILGLSFEDEFRRLALDTCDALLLVQKLSISSHDAYLNVG